MTDAEKLRRIRHALCPSPRRDRQGRNVTADAYHNLSGAIIDIEHGRCDGTVLRTLKRVCCQIAKAQLALEGAKE